MASIFTFDPDPPRVSSPWATPPVGNVARSSTPHSLSKPLPARCSRSSDQRESAGNPQTPAIDYTSITRLEAEPQEGPTEYKLHLLLRRRRSFTRASTGRHISGSMRRSDTPLPIPVGRSVSESVLLANSTPPLASTQSKQHRLEQLTTQLLWRLQQSCPYHISSSTAPVIPHLADDVRLSALDMPQRLLPGLEESKGALYEIGIADDGTIVGLAEDEMEESLNNLRAMAASLGCGVEVLRRVSVGECEWVEYAGTPQESVQRSSLLVAEALVRPDQHLIDHTKETQQDANNIPLHSVSSDVALTELANEARRSTEQLRVSVTGATMSGKSSLLGTLSTATLDNGRGKSRLSLLKHRHEIASGMTSSVTQELIGYRDFVDHETTSATQVISYGSGDVSSWIDIHAAVGAAENGRLVLLSDSAGHPRFRRTTVRGIVGWQPHWTVLCVPADNTDDSSGKIGASPTSEELLGPAAAELDLSHGHLQLCLALELPLVIVITKYDLATKAGLRQTLTKLLSAVKDVDRKPYIITDTSTSVLEADLQTIEPSDLEDADKVVRLLADSPLSAVPVVLTSSVKGTGIHKLHALLRRLPVPTQDVSSSSTPQLPLFYIEDVYSVRTNTSADRSAIIGGYLRYGSLSIGDELLLGPYPVDMSSDDSDSSSARLSRKSSIPQSRSFPGALNTKSTNASLRDRHSAWRRVRITSLRNLRLPVRTLHAGQVGTMGIMPVDTPILSPSINRIRKGMVLAARESKAYKVITVRFEKGQAEGVKDLGVGSAVVVYIASVRASSKVVSVATAPTEIVPAVPKEDDEDDAFGLGYEPEPERQAHDSAPPPVVVTFQFIASKEFVELGAKVLVMPGGGPGLSGGNERGAKGMAGLEGFVGRVVENV
ncbi:GTP-binding protein-like protein 2 [Decorospora gaudefroyi]|uniref:GTP-binding protein-like protein 2 n=1 Tax=Decorospora gaudefroyi TaxID=184978 RepID=A0A6A5KWB1_9PLEO|nr:GTP-binding protein-like protein 2 [Decorospora gaudefroyi]